ncbi:MAG: TIGR02281 family clan AA aspartic protease [Gammaproteobacteria bacterium]|nr:TIGR02281 family clan AA aspartic protease [Gammaproteobacteria bacterium]MDH5736219.1 TIGR02281 family clan AA aspartic protease [Gammaproteobacteria bacterium]
MNDINPEKKIAGKLFFLMWLVLLALLSYMFNIILDKQINPNKNPLSSQYADGSRELTLNRNRLGHYITSGTINNHEVVFMLDTGATDVSIPESIANQLGLTRGTAMTYITANGNAIVYSTTIDSIAIKDIQLENIRATINPNTDEEIILLGMSFLKHLEFTQRGDTLTLRQFSTSL